MMFIVRMVLGNRYGLIAVGLFVGLSAALTWHYVDKAAAVRSAERELADKVLIETQSAQLKELERHALIAEEARSELERWIKVANADAEQARQELEEYERTTEINAACAVDPGILNRLRNR